MKLNFKNNYRIAKIFTAECILVFGMILCGPWGILSHTAVAETGKSTSFRLVIQDNLWFRGKPYYSNYEINGKSMIPIEPLLGLTDSDDRLVKAQELQWLFRYTGRNGSGLVISQEWIKPNDLVDNNIRGTFLPLINQHGQKVLWNIFYDPVLAAIQRNLADAPSINFQDPAIRKMWEDDLKYFRKLYFNHPKYWKINGKPVLYIWAVSGLIGADDAFAEARKKGIYLLGDVMTMQVNNPSYLDSLPPLDCATGFLVVVPGLASAETTIGEIIPAFATLYKDWNREAAKRNMSFIPAGSCQYDDSEFASLIGASPKRILAQNCSEVGKFLKTALSKAKPVYGTRYIFWGTANNWAEGTTILPTKLVPPEKRFYVPSRFKGKRVRRIGHYGFEHLKAVKKVLFPKEKDYMGPILKSGKPVLVKTTQAEKVYRLDVTFSDCDVKGKLSINKPDNFTILNPPNFKTSKNITELKGFRYRWKAEVAIDTTKNPGSVSTMWIKFKNLDAKVTRRWIDFQR